MKLIVQIPCLNEEKTLPLVLASIPKRIEGVDRVETLVIDDGSSDNTVKVAKKFGVNHIVLHKSNRGLAAAFETGINESLKLGADIIVNTDADNQYPQEDIPKLIKPILDGKSEIVIADRQTDKIKHFSKTKKFLQKIGSKVVQMASGAKIKDAPSGFRAYSKYAAMSLNVVTDFSYVIETIVHAGKRKVPMSNVRVKTNPQTRPSRLFKTINQHVFRSTQAIIRSYMMHEPMKIFLISGTTILAIGSIPFVTFITKSILMGEALSGHIQSLIFGGVFIILGIMTIVIGLMADLIAINRKLQEDSLFRLKNIEFNLLARFKKNDKRWKN